jgi:hypothetical protein
MGIAGQIVELLELAKHGEGGGCAEGCFEFWKVCDLVAQQMLAKGIGIEGGWSHNVIVPTTNRSQSEL